MPPPTDRWPRAAASYAALVGLVLLVAVPVCVAIDPVHRPLVMRLAAAFVLGAALVDATRLLRERYDAQPRSRFEAALRRPAAAADGHEHLRMLRDEFRAAAARVSYFERVLFPRLVELAGWLPGRPRLIPPARSRLRRLLRRGPAPADLRALVARLEEDA